MKRMLGRLIKWLGIAVLAMLCAALLYILVILNDTPERGSGAEAGAVRPVAQGSLPSGGSALSVQSLAQAKQYFDGQILMLSDMGDHELMAIELLDWQPKGMGSPVREVRLRYEGNGQTLWVSSLTPADVVASLPGRGYAPLVEQNMALAGQQAVALSGPEGASLHVHARLKDIIYQIEGSIEQEALRQIAWQAKLSY